MKTFFGAPNITTQFLRNDFANRLLFVTNDAALNLENWSTTWRYYRFGFNSCKMSDNVSLKESDFVNMQQLVLKVVFEIFDMFR